MDEAEQFASMVRTALARYDVAVDDIDVAVITAVEQVYGASQRALLEADLSAVAPEPDLDPGRAPSESWSTAKRS